MRGAQWYLNYPIPLELRGNYLTEAGKPRDHIVQATGTPDLNHADRIKHGLITALEQDFARKRRELSGSLPADLRTAKRFAADLEAAANHESYDPIHGLVSYDPVHDLVTDRADLIFNEGGRTKEALERAKTFVSAAYGKETVTDAFEDWMQHSVSAERNRSKYRTAVQEFADFLGGIALVSHMTRANAIRYVDWLNKEARSQRTHKMIPLSFNTKRDRVMALSAFWNQWLSPRGKVTEGVNPWSRLVVTEKPTPSTVQWDNLGNTGRPQRREAFEDTDLISIFDAPGPRTGGNTRYGKPLLMEVFTLALLTGARPDELCSLTLNEVTLKDGAYWLTFDETKTKDDRQIPVVHPVALGLLQRRIGQRTASPEQLFPELKAKGKGTNLYELVGRALGRHLDRAVALDSEDVPYMARHTFATVVGNMDGVQDHALKRYNSTPSALDWANKLSGAVGLQSLPKHAPRPNLSSTWCIAGSCALASWSSYALPPPSLHWPAAPSRGHTGS